MKQHPDTYKLFTGLGNIVFNCYLLGIFGSEALLILLEFLLQMVGKRKAIVSASVDHHDFSPGLKDVCSGFFLVIKDVYLGILGMRFNGNDTSVTAFPVPLGIYIIFILPI